MMFPKGVLHCFYTGGAYYGSALRAAAECCFVFTPCATLGYFKESFHSSYMALLPETAGDRRLLVNDEISYSKIPFYPLSFTDWGGFCFTGFELFTGT